MQTALWYLHRLRRMPPGEICWRLAAGVRGTLDYCLAPVRRHPLALSRVVTKNGQEKAQSEGFSGGRLPTVGNGTDDGDLVGQWRRSLISRANEAYENKLTFFDLRGYDLGAPIDWNFEHVAGKRTPMGFAPRIDYRDYQATGDAKVVWEPNRHQQLVVLGRAYRLTGDRRYAEKVVEQLESWIDQCPFGQGMNWRSPLELAVRLINWVWALELISPAGLITAERSRRLLPVVYRHLWDVSRKYSRFSSANNHLIGEAAGVFIGSTYFRDLKKASSWADESQRILSDEILRQTSSDGGTSEHALGYHLFVLEFFLLAGLTARNLGRDFAPSYWHRLEKMFEFVAAFAEGGPLPLFGDADDGYVLDLGGREDPARALLAVGAAVFERRDFDELSRGCSEPRFWLLGSEACETAEGRVDEAADDQQPATDRSAIGSRALPESGYYLLQSGHLDSPDRISVGFDCADLGFGPIAAHGHADALSFTLRVGGADVFVDPGTYDYFTYPQWRDYFRSTRAHNTIVVDDQDQSEVLGPFLWGRRAIARCLRWQPLPDGGTVTGEHDGYSHLSDPVVHRRTISLDARRSEVLVSDELLAEETHDAALYLHVAERAGVRCVGRNRYRVECGDSAVVVSFDASQSVTLVRGSRDPILGWVSRGYHCKKPATTFMARRRWTGRMSTELRIAIEAPWGSGASEGAGQHQPAEAG